MVVICGPLPQDVCLHSKSQGSELIDDNGDDDDADVVVEMMMMVRW